LSPKEKEEQCEFLSQNLCLQRIRCSKSPYASGFFLIQKKDGKFRPVQDYRNLNKWTIPNKYLLPLILELIYNLAEKHLFSKFDIRWGYNNIRIKEGDEYKAAFKTSKGLFKPTVMFFGLTNSPATFQTMMDDIFQEEVAQGWLRIYMDDMIITTKDNEILHELHINHILDKLVKFDLFLKPEKCRFHQHEVEYLGVLIGNGSVKMDPIKVQGISEWPTLLTVKDVRSFLGFCNFYRVFIKNFSDIARCYDPPQFFSSLLDPLLVTLSTPKRPLPLNPSSLPDLPPLPPSEPSKPSSPLDQPPVEPLIPVPWNIHCREYSSMEMYQEPSPVENPLEDPDSPMEDAPPLEPQPVTHYEPGVPGGQTHTLSPEESPIEPWEAYLTQPSSPVSRKHSLSTTSLSSAPIRQRTSREGSYQSITPSASSPIASTSPQSQGYQSTSPGGSADNPSSTQSSADDADSNMALNWVTINTDYLKG